MILYVILTFVAILIGMAISVMAFGTGGKRKKIFQNIYFSLEEVNGIGVLYTKTGEYSAILKMENPVQKYSADIDSYYEFNHLFTALAQTLGDGYAIHKQDVFIRKKFHDDSNDNHEFLSESYFNYFTGRTYTDCQSYMIITQENKKSNLFSFDSKKWRDFMVKIRKVKDQLRDSGVDAQFLDGNKARDYVDRYFSMNFTDKNLSMNNFKVDDEAITMGDRRCKIYSLVDVDCINIPSLVRPFTNIEVNNVSMPVDMVSLLDSIPSAEMVVYNQMLFIPNQKKELSLLEKKKNRHASMPNPSNQIAVEDIISILSLEYPSIRIFSDVPIIWRISSASWESTSASNRTISWSFLSIHSPAIAILPIPNTTASLPLVMQQLALCTRKGFSIAKKHR